MKPLLFLLLLCLAAHAGPVTKAKKTEAAAAAAAAAPRQEVNLLMFGIIQLSQAFKYVHETTEAKMEKIGQVLRRQEETLQTLGAQAEQAAEAGKEMEEVLHRIQVRDGGGDM